ncbi:MAG: GxxExxY protein, partial [Spirochaetota bacterium]
ECLCRELEVAGLRFERQKEIPVVYKGKPVSAAFRADVVIEGSVILELKSVETVLKVHEAQLLTYLRMSGIGIGLLINFNVPILRDGIKRFVL